MFKKFKPYLCWGSAVRQTAIEKENEKRQENTSNLYNVEVENVKVDETYLPSDEVCLIIYANSYLICPNIIHERSMCLEKIRSY